MKLIATLAALGFSVLSPGVAWSEAEVPRCSTTVQAEAVITNSTTGNQLVVAVAQSVPTDPKNCVPNYCVASSNESDDVKVAVGAGMSEAYEQLVAAGKDDDAFDLLGDACSQYCDEKTLTAFAASQSNSVRGLCDMALGGVGGPPPSILIISGGSGSGGGRSASPN